MTDEIERFQSHLAMLEADCIQRIRQQLTGISALFCDDCGAPVPAERRRLIPGVRKCVGCRAVEEMLSRQYRRRP
ncbi:TraR/DksA C4-type zinc finger protein [Salmonella enterica]|uniref:TraR/DksA C4-type zinc finger protein n=2 Tax=Salmonella enterica TaxID=28901 RepID=UPI001418512C|nr:conjugal transfer protein TraR [Salmonella enterica subsp. enterica serovar Johannesburg]EEM6847493.1 conjugal transfer protein TraR [Salmonella enterica subsp. enterica serovar Montevideo]